MIRPKLNPGVMQTSYRDTLTNARLRRLEARKA
jgi:hypothetical protein